ncbi:OLC1v1030297C1 [Oldenlandia corymbosa var. corymbosa]|uniref:OLC1v1030297C1 n=1 Tax=Oldenlandia corymbosa var. corymbosa TaxID=529605 RepID=A0AAV1CGH9_OLDCO|nr:OLC1v1030297C1 [Oldenlandia corymbosa var. corymbosa]
MAVLTNSDCTLDDWPLSYYDDNIIYEPNINIVPNHHHQEDIVASSGVPTSSVNGGVPDYNNLFMSSLDQYMHEDIYMAPYLGNRFCDGSQDEQQIIDVDQHHYYSQESFLWNF